MKIAHFSPPLSVMCYKNVALAGALLTWLSMKRALADKEIGRKLKQV